jgi:hypothetical protein
VQIRTKVKHRESRDVVIGAVIGSIQHPDVIIAGLPDVDGSLTIVERTTALNRSQSESLWKVLRSSSHPHAWPQWIGSGWSWLR